MNTNIEMFSESQTNALAIIGKTVSQAVISVRTEFGVNISFLKSEKQPLISNNKALYSFYEGRVPSATNQTGHWRCLTILSALMSE